MGQQGIPGSRRHAETHQGQRAEHLCVDQLVHRTGIRFIQGRHGKGLLHQAPQRSGMAVGYVAARHGDRGFHKPCRMEMVPGQARDPARHGCRLLQDGLWRADPDRRCLL